MAADLLLAIPFLALCVLIVWEVRKGLRTQFGERWVTGALWRL